MKQSNNLNADRSPIERDIKVYILLPVHNRKHLTQKFVECLISQTNQNYHLVLIDDGSSDGTESMVRSYVDSVTVLKGRGNWWWAGSLQQGYEWLSKQEIPSSDIVLMINDDTQFEENFLEEGVRLMSNSTRAMMLAQCYSDATGQLIDRGVSIDWNKLTFEQAETQESINCFSTNGLMMRYGDFIATKGFYPKLLPHYTSDYEYTVRAIRQGLQPMVSSRFKLCLNEKTTGYHKIESEDNISTSFWDFISKYFSLKSPTNPFYLTLFILLACPMRWKIKNLIRIWKRSVITVSKKLMTQNA